MDAIKSSVAAVVWLIANAAFAQGADQEWFDETASGGSATVPHHEDSVALSVLMLDQSSDTEGHSRQGQIHVTHHLPDYQLGPAAGFLASTGFQYLSGPATASFIQQQTGIDTRSMLSAEHWLGQDNGIAQTVTVGHVWRDLTVEGMAYTAQDDSQAHGRREIRRIDSRSARLSFSPAPNWVVRLTRGTVSGLDHLVAGEEVRRTAVSASYRRAFAEGDWEATIAWGRNSRKFREATVGYLVESAYRFNGVHSIFGRLEQVGSDEIARENESLQRQLFMMNKLTLGYSQDLRLTSSLRVDAGAYVARHFVPSSMSPSYGTGPTAYMMFVRLKLQ